MIQTKLFQFRRLTMDEPVFATLVDAAHEKATLAEQAALLSLAIGVEDGAQRLILVGQLVKASRRRDDMIHRSPWPWFVIDHSTKEEEAYRVLYDYILAHWDDLKSGQAIDYLYITGRSESARPPSWELQLYAAA